MSFSSNSIPVMRPKLPTEKRLRKYLKRIDQNRIYTNYGPLVDDLTNRLATYFGVEVNQLILLTNGTLALQGAVATSSELGSMWNCPSWTFVATSQSIISAGCIPQFVDVGSDNWTVPKVLETCIDITDVFIFIDYLVLRSSGILTLSPKVYGSNSVQSSLGNVLISLRRQSDRLWDLTECF